MCSTFKLAKNIIDELVSSKEPFTLEQISNAIRNANGVHRVAAGVTTQDYLDILEEEDKIVYDFSTMKYFNVTTLEEKRVERHAAL